MEKFSIGTPRAILARQAADRFCEKLVSKIQVLVGTVRAAHYKSFNGTTQERLWKKFESARKSVLKAACTFEVFADYLITTTKLLL